MKKNVTGGRINMIQILTYTGKETDLQGKDISLNNFHDAKSLDEFDVNIISLADEKIWKNKGYDKESINVIDDLKSLSVMIYNSKNAIIIILLPQNERYYYGYNNKDYTYCEELKNMIPNLCNIMSKLFRPIGMLEYIYENTNTRIGNENISAAFYLCVDDNILLESDKSKKPTVVEVGNVILSTLNLKTYEQVINFLRELKLIQDKQDVPAWMEEVKMFDDIQQLQIIEENNQAIRVANDNISNAMERINKNNEYKSILYTSGDELVNVVFEILKEMLGCDLSEFEDKKKEDFSFERNGIVYIGEIKGISSNVKSQNISQLEFHHQGFIDEHPEVDDKDIRQILIINHQRNIPLPQRDPVDRKQIELASRYGSLIVESVTLLKLFEKHLNGNLPTEECLEILKSNVGLLEI